MEDNCKQLCKDTHTKPKNVLNLGQFPYLSVIPKTSQVYEYNNTHTYEGALDPQVIGDILKNVFEKNKQIFYNSVLQASVNYPYYFSPVSKFLYQRTGL